MNATQILVLNGPNLNLLGKREPSLYGLNTLADIEQRLLSLAKTANCTLTFIQSNAEHTLIEHIHAAMGKIQFIIINPAAYTHTSVALRDALLAVQIAFIEVHLSNVHAREPFRQQSYLSDIAVGVISGLGSQGYEFAFHAAIHHLQKE